MDNFFERPPRKELNELNLVPVIDMFTTVIFFLLLSTVFVSLSKLTVPPSRVSTITDPVEPPPVAAIMVVGETGPQIKLQLSWSGKQPGSSSEALSEQDVEANPQLLIDAAKKLADGFHKSYPDEESLRLGMKRELPYQRLISVMDGVRDALPDLVLISYDEAEAKMQGSSP